MSQENQTSVEPQVLIEALNDPKKGEELIKKMGWDKKQLVSEAAKLIAQLSKGISHVNMV